MRKNDKEGNMYRMQIIAQDQSVLFSDMFKLTDEEFGEWCGVIDNQGGTYSDCDNIVSIPESIASSCIIIVKRFPDGEK